MDDLISPRQQKLLLSIISEFINTAEAVGSISLQNKYRFKVSPATIRNEMAELVLHGYLFQKHSSGGRIPTTKGWRFFIESLGEKEWQEVDVITKEQIKSELSKIKFDKRSLIRQSIQFLSKISGNAAVALVGDEVYYAGLAEMIKIPEFHESQSLENILRVLEDYLTLSEIFNVKSIDDDVQILVGDEIGKDELKDYAVIFSEIRIHGSQSGYISVIGPNRINYGLVVPAVRYISETIRNLVKGW